MVSSLFNHIKNDITKDYRISNLRDRLHETGALKKFEGVFGDYGQDAERIITYLIFTYSFDSSFVVSGEDWLETKKGIMDLLNLDTEKFQDVLFFEKQSVKTAITYLSKEIKDYRYYQIIVWKESCQILDQIATTKPDSKNKAGAKNIFDGAKYSFDLKTKIGNLELEIRQTSKHQERLKEVSDLNISTISMERILKELRQ